MSPTFEIVEPKPWHVGQMIRRLRREHLHAIAALGVRGHHELRDRFDESMFRRAWLIDGQLAALGGVTGSALSVDGMVWLALSLEATRYPLAIVREARRQLDLITRTRARLYTTILDADETAKRFAAFVGFVAADERPGEKAVSRFGRRMVLDALAEKVDVRVPVGAGHALVMQYEREAA